MRVKRFGAGLAGGTGLALVMMTEAERRAGRFLRAPDHDGAAGGGDGEGGDGGEAAAGGAGAGGAGSGADTGGGAGGDGAGSGGDGGDGGAGASWFDGLSDTNGDDKRLSDLAWMKNKNYADLSTAVAAMRGLESKLAQKGVVVPGDDASDEEKAAYRKATGVPDAVAGYEDPKIPDGFEADVALLAPLKELALAGGIPAPMFKALAQGLVDAQLVQVNAEIAAHDKQRDAVFAEWGAQKDHNTALFQRGMEAFGIDAEKAVALQRVMGSDWVMKHGLKLGQLSGEDGFIPGGRKSFGIAPAEARTRLNQLERDKGFHERLAAKDPAAVAEHERLIAVIDQDEQDKARRTA